MKHIFTFFSLFALLFASERMQAQCTANFITYNGPNGSVTFTSTSAPTNSLTQYAWYFGNGSSYTASGNPGMTTTQQYTANGTYLVILYITNSNPTCMDSISQTIVVSNYVPPGGCSLNAGYSNYLGGGSGTMNFSNNSSGTVAATTYTWNYGDGSANTFGTNGAHTYTANGNYTVTLFADNNTTPSCVDTQTMPVTITTACNLNASFNITPGNNGSVNFASTSTGTTSASFMYYWYFGDGGSAYGTSVSHVYLNGSYTASLIVIDSLATPSCSDIAIQALTVSNNTCQSQAVFSYTQGANGLVNYSNQSTGANASTTYTWNFGNGTISFSAGNPSTTYLNGGFYTVLLYMDNGNGCVKTSTQIVSVNSVSCTANANFTLNYGGSPGVWNAIPAYPWNVSFANWSWGDGGYSYNLYGTHNYSVSANYNICLSVGANCGDSATACSTYSVYRSAAAAMVQINVIAPTLKNVDNANTTGIVNHTPLNFKLSVNPNPSNGQFMLMASGMNSDKLSISIHDSMGRLILKQDQTTTGDQVMNLLDLSQQADGIYFISVQNGTQELNSKVLLQH